ncbi:hypothetical protein B2H97_00805 [Paraclostridium bifermentans]|uniref:hypothetical protein n=1 Tax=Paraclostridium bifermentans TaxID=1490 RepID=UPI000A173C9A|nr:hypothetical protein [Paraclostridium bifermentans]OSB11678.1 hypothetical protein B2H97_00805 [Paraclostridium bifermentans]
MSDIDIIKNNRSRYRYVQRKIPVIKNEELVKWYNFLLLENQDTFEIIVSEFTDFFIHKNRLNLSIKTKMNNYGNTILMFLNYIFFERENPVSSIVDITIELGNEFINAYGIGDIGARGTKSNDSINRVANSLTIFYHWLYKDSGYNLKHIKKTSFRIVSYSVKTPNSSIDKTKLDTLFTYEIYNKVLDRKLENPSEFIVYSLLQIAEQYDPIMAFPIALGAFAGLRQGEICQICLQRIQYTAVFGRSTCFYIDLQKEKLLRADGISTGDIKRPRVQLVYESFLPYLDRLYKTHKEILKKYGFNQNTFGALLVDNNGNAMTTHTFSQRYNNLVIKLIERLNDLSNKNNFEAALNLDLLLKYKMTPHSLRYFFSEYVGQREPTHILAMYRGDLNLNSALTYLKSSAKKSEYIVEIQDSFIFSYCNLTGLNIDKFKEYLYD